MDVTLLVVDELLDWLAVNGELEEIGSCLHWRRGRVGVAVGVAIVSEELASAHGLDEEAERNVAYVHVDLILVD